MGLGEVGEGGYRSLYGRFEIGHIFSPLITFFPSQQSTSSLWGQLLLYVIHVHTDFTLKMIARIFLLEFTENLIEGSQQTLNTFLELGTQC